MVAHCGGKYDFHFLIKYLVDIGMGSSVKMDSVIYKGLKLISLQANSLLFVDSYSHLPMPLSKLPATFGFAGEEKKGTQYYTTLKTIKYILGEFPFLAIQEKYRGYVGKFPALEMFLAKHKKPDQLREFLKYFSQNKDRNNWSHDEELIGYCISDTVIVAKSVTKYDKVFRELAGFSPLTVPTLPAAAMHCFR